MREPDDDELVTIDWLHETAGSNVAFYRSSVEILVTGEGLRQGAWGRWYLSLGRLQNGSRTVTLASETTGQQVCRCEIYIGSISTRREFRRLYEQFAASFWPKR